MRRENLKNNAITKVSLVLLSLVFLHPRTSVPQMSSPGRFHLTSTPPGENITINNILRKEKTPITLAVVPGKYNIQIGSCTFSQVPVAAGETKELTCNK